MRRIAFGLLGLFVLVLAACSPAEPTPPPKAELSLTATDIAYDTNRFEVVAGQTVFLTMRNDGALAHDFSIMAMPHTGEPVVSEMNEEMPGHDMSEMEEEPQIHVASPPGGSNSIEFTPSDPGEYEFYCTVAGHKEAGMKGTLVVLAP